MKELEIAARVTTPLALAALCLLLGSGLLKTVAKAKSSAAIKLTIRWGFILAIVLGVLANICFLVIASFGREARVAGTVRDQAGKAVPFAIVDLGGKKGRAITDDYGEFELNIPDSRTATEYRLVVNAEGFASTNLAILGPRPTEQIEVTLRRPKFSAKDFLHLKRIANLRHYLGVPQFETTVEFSNPYSHRITLENISLVLTSSSGAVVPLSLEGTMLPNSAQMMPALVPIIPLEKGQSWTLTCSFFNRDPAVFEKLAKAQAEVPLLRTMPNPDDQLYSASLVAEFRDLMNRRMVWKAGEWKGELSWSVRGIAYQQVFQFLVSDEDVSRMRAIGKYYGAGYGVLPDLRFYRVADANPTATITLHENP